MILTDSAHYAVYPIEERSVVVAEAPATVLVAESADGVLVLPAGEASAVLTVRQDASVIASREVPFVQLNNVGLQGPQGPQGPPGAGTLYADEITVTPAIQAAKQVALSAPPAGRVELIVYGGVEQRQGVDFTVSGAVLQWAGLALELLLAPGDSMTARYSN